MKNTVKLSESQLRKIIAESMKKVLNEGKKVNNKPYFQTSKDEYGIEGYLGNDDEYLYSKNGDDSIRIPGSEFAKKDAAKKLPNSDETEFDLAAARHEDRAIAQEMPPKQYDRNMIVSVAKLGLPVEIARQLPRITLRTILNAAKKQ